MMPRVGGLGGAGRGFVEQYHAYSVVFSGRSGLEDGDKILLPASALDTLARMQVQYPMLFELRASGGGAGGGAAAGGADGEGEPRRTHCGVLEFSAEEGKAFIPFWMMQNLCLAEGALITVRNVSLPKATYLKIRPLSDDFLEISNPRAVLEMKLRTFSCVTVGDQICINYNDKNYHIEVRDVKPAEAASIIETDCNVDFEAPPGYEERMAKKAQEAAAAAAGVSGRGAASAAAPGAKDGEDDGDGRELQRARVESKEEPSFVPFSGQGRRIDGKGAGSDGAPGAGESKGGGGSGGGAVSSKGTDSKQERRGRSLSESADARANAASAAMARAESKSQQQPQQPPRRSRIAGKYSSRAKKVTSFAGQGNTLGAGGGGGGTGGSAGRGAPAR